jgi:hypothetical protein
LSEAGFPEEIQPFILSHATQNHRSFYIQISPLILYIPNIYQGRDITAGQVYPEGTKESGSASRDDFNRAKKMGTHFLGISGIFRISRINGH